MGGGVGSEGSRREYPINVFIKGSDSLMPTDGERKPALWRHGTRPKTLAGGTDLFDEDGVTSHFELADDSHLMACE
jgi:hypothetical protein